MKGEKVFPFIEREDYPLDFWITDVLNLIKQRNPFITDKQQAFHVFVDNASEFMSMYAEGESPKVAVNDFEGIDE